MESVITFIGIMIILWALEMRFKDSKRSFEQLNEIAEDLKNRLKKIEEDMVNLYIKEKPK